MAKCVSGEFQNVPAGFEGYYNETIGLYTLESSTETWLCSEDYDLFQEKLNKLVIEFGLEVE